MKKLKIPKLKLKPIDLMKATHKPEHGGCNRQTVHPDISLKKLYLAKNRGRYAVGYFSMQWYGLNFDGFYDAGLQFDMPGTNASGWEGLWELIET